MVTGILVFHVIVCILLTVIVLLQFGKGAEAGAMMGGGASQNIFTSSSRGNFFTKLTAVLAILFLVNSIVLTMIMSDNNKSVFDNEAPIAAPLNSDALEQKMEATTPEAKEGEGTTEAKEEKGETTTDNK